MVALWRFGRRALAAALALLAGASLALALRTAPEAPQAAFYLIHTRAWELLAGVLAALAVPHLAPRVSRRVARALAALGLGLVVVGLVALPEQGVWPGPYTLVPVAGAIALLMFGAPDAAASRLLGLAPLVGLGLVSYSAYLWHQPILGFLAIVGQKPATTPGIAAAVAATLAVAWASWALVEQPFRTRRLPARIGRPALGLAAAAIAAFALGGHVTEGYPGRLPAAARAALAWGQSWPSRYWDCVGGRAEALRLDPAQACVHGAPVPPRVAIWGDSHAATLAEPLGLALAAEGVAVLELSVGGCMPVSGAINSGQNRSRTCAEHNARMLDFLTQERGIEVVVVHSYWNYFVERRDFDNGTGSVRPDDLFAQDPGGAPDASDAERVGYLTARLQEDISRLTAAGKQVLLSYPLPEPGFDVPDHLARLAMLGRPGPSTMVIPEAAFRDYSRLARAMLDGVGVRPVLTRIDLSPALCLEDLLCRVVDAGEPLYFDDNHLSRAGAARVVPALAAAVAAMLMPRDTGMP
jgi:hypothetical protein